MFRRQFLTIVLSGMVAAVARGYVDPAGYHRHRCNKDGYIWSHKPGGSHNCPRCGQAQYVHYSGPDPPTPRATGGFIPAGKVPVLLEPKGWSH